MPDEFGTPEAPDATAMHEKTVQEAGEYAASLDKAVKEDLLNRPLGSVKVTPEQRKQEWTVNFQAAEAGDPSLMAKFFTDQKATVEQMVKYATGMLK